MDPPCEFPMDSLWIPYGSPYGFPMDSPWASDPETSQARVANFVSPQIVLLKTLYDFLF